jgi:hypothetical protein
MKDRPKTDPAINEAEQGARALKRQRNKDAAVIAIVAGLLKVEAAILDSVDQVHSRALNRDEAVTSAMLLLDTAKQKCVSQ